MATTEKSQLDFSVTTDDLEISTEISFEIMNFTPERPAPSCSNPSSPAFSDDGDPMEYDVSAVILIINGVEIEITGEAAEEIRKACEVKLDSRVSEIGQSIIDDNYESAMIEKYEDDLMERRGA